MMELTYTCIRCGHERGVSDVILDVVDDAAFHAAVQAAAQLPPLLADSVIRYMRFFGNIRHATYAKVLADLVTAINTGRFVFKRQEYQASPALWLSALTDILASTTVRLPLKAANGHNFLFAIAADKATKAAAAAEQRREETLRHRSADLTQAALASPAQTSTDLRRRALEADVRHWEQQCQIHPNDARIAQILSSARAKLAADFPPHAC